MDETVFQGFTPPTANFSKLPHDLIDQFPNIKTLGEMKVILYILRHTWGFGDAEKRITLDEFEHGRKKRDGTRIDHGIGMSKPTIILGLEYAETHGFITSREEGDAGRIEKYYSLNDGTSKESLQGVVKELDRGSKEPLHRSEKDTKKDTKETTTFASPRGNAAEPIRYTPRWDNAVDEMITWPDTAFQSNRIEAMRYVSGLMKRGLIMLDMEPGEVLAIVKSELIAPPPTTPQLPKAVEEEVREERAKKAGKPNPIFDAVAVGSFGLEDVNGDKVAGARIGKIAAWLKKQPGEITPEMIMSFYGWYDRENNHTARPRDVVKFAEHWLKWQAENTKPTYDPRKDPTVMQAYVPEGGYVIE